ncbi:hypothetical protein AusDCA_2458 [Desulfitobacterium sp. AusDCA]
MLLFAVALYERAWIEIIQTYGRKAPVCYVALYERAWIEIYSLQNNNATIRSRSLRESVD